MKKLFLLSLICLMSFAYQSNDLIPAWSFKKANNFKKLIWNNQNIPIALSNLRNAAQEGKNISDYIKNHENTVGYENS